jgi:hypothetical protein
MPKVCCGPCLTLGEVVMSALGRELPRDPSRGSVSKGSGSGPSRAGRRSAAVGQKRSLPGVFNGNVGPLISKSRCAGFHGGEGSRDLCARSRDKRSSLI